MERGKYQQLRKGLLASKGSEAGKNGEEEQQGGQTRGREGSSSQGRTKRAGKRRDMVKIREEESQGEREAEKGLEGTGEKKQ